MVKMKVDQDLCIGCGACVSMCPQVFKLEEGKSKVFSEDQNCACDLQEVADSCPVSAILKEE
jgi:ferredoxin